MATHPDLTTRYLRHELKNPIVASAGPLTGQLDTLRRIEDAGAAAAVLPSLFEEQIVHEETAIHQLHELNTDSFAESLDFFPELDDYNTGPESYLDYVRSAKDAVDIPVIASLNGATPGGWVDYARLIQQAGADAIELNILIVPTNPDETSEQVEQRYIEIVSSVRSATSLPLAVKMGPYVSALPHLAVRIVDAGADALVLFNRYLEPDIDLETLEVVPHLVLSSREEMRLPLRWIGILHGRVSASLAATSGIHQVEDVVKMLLAGADVTMLTSALLQRGPEYIRELLTQLHQWLGEREYESVRQMQGSVSQQNCADPSGYTRANYMKALVSYTGKKI